MTSDMILMLIVGFMVGFVVGVGFALSVVAEPPKGGES